FVNAVPPDVPLEVLGRIERPIIMDCDRAHPIMRHVELAKVAIEDALRIRPLAAGRPLVEAVGGPLIYALEEPDRKGNFIGFDLFKTDFPLRSEEHTSELQSRGHLVCRLLVEKINTEHHHRIPIVYER